MASRGVSSRLARGVVGGLSVCLGGAGLVMLPYVPRTAVKIALTTLGVELPSVIYVIGNAHTNTIEGFFGNLKTSLRGTYKHVSHKWLQSYLDEFAWRYNHRHDTRAQFETLLAKAAGRWEGLIVVVVRRRQRKWEEDRLHRFCLAYQPVLGKRTSRVFLRPPPHWTPQRPPTCGHGRSAEVL